MEFKCECGRHFNRRLADLQKEIDYKCGFCNSHHNYTYQEVKETLGKKALQFAFLFIQYVIRANQIYVKQIK